MAGAALLTAVCAGAPAADFDPFAEARVPQRIGNVETGIPPQCYARSGPSNSCYICHTPPRGTNRADDARLQLRYDFSPLRHNNPWTNLFVDRRRPIAAVRDREILAWVREDNFTPLRMALSKSPDHSAWKPDVDLSKGFDERGFARDGSQWRAFRYKPFPGSFWPTNGSADEVMIRLPAALREDAQGRPSEEIYRTNLAIVEAMIGTPANLADADIDREIEPVDERVSGIDLDGDGRLGTATRLRGRPLHYAGHSQSVPRRGRYPRGTEFLHTVRYLDPDAADFAGRRLKELRYAVKTLEVDDASIALHYAESAKEQVTGERPRYTGNALTGQSNNFGWTLSGYIEDSQGRLRLQTREEQLYCMGCHTGIGITVDQTFSMPRKLPGQLGWGLQSLQGQHDVAQWGKQRGEYSDYMERVGGGDDFRANPELLERLFIAGNLNRQRLAGLDAQQGISGWLLPSAKRALALDAAYRLVVREQSFKHGRDTLSRPVENAYRQIESSDPAPVAADQEFDDAQIWLDWTPKRTDTHSVRASAGVSR